MKGKFDLYFQTLKHVKPIQLYYQLYYRIKNRFFQQNYDVETPAAYKLQFKPGILFQKSFLGDCKFSFLNLSRTFQDIDWNYSEFGKLWTYNLNYFDFLNQEDIHNEVGLSFIKDYIQKKHILKDGLEPYPISLRGINWVKFINKQDIQDPEINKVLYNDFLRLSKNLEYHLLANHLLENGFSLLFGAFYFKNEDFYFKAKKIIVTELEKQILNDGAHYELSPMYHQIILHRILDCYNLVRNNAWKDQELLEFLKVNAEIMLGWLQVISFRNGDLPKLNDSQVGIAPKSSDLSNYAENLGLVPNNINLDDSGYRKFDFHEFEIIMDVGQIAPSYQPGHSHADSLQLILNYNNKPIIVDSGISTYEKNERRQVERSTSSHNTVTIDGTDSSKVWGGFRVAERAKVSIEKDEDDHIEASHDGYRNFGIVHKRSFRRKSKDFMIEDIIQGNLKRLAKGHIHFHPQVDVQLDANSVILDSELKIEFSGISKLEACEYKFAEAFNKLVESKKIVYNFQQKAVITVKSFVLDTISTTASAEPKTTRTDPFQ